MHFILMVLAASIVSCSSLTTPEIRSPRFQTGNSGYQSSQFKPQTPESKEASIAPSQDGDPTLLSWPVRGEVRFSRGFKLGGRPHQGLDLAAPRGTGVFAAHEGYVEYAGMDFSGYGKLVILNTGAGWATFYAHLNRIRVKEGAKIVRGQKIGDMGATGRASGVHLHFELRYNERPVDPLDYLPPL